MPLIDHATKWVVGWAVGHRPNTELALEALAMAAAAPADAEVTFDGRIIHHDQDSVYTSYKWLRPVLITHRARISFSENGAKGNTAMESFNSRFKGENKSLFFEGGEHLGTGAIDRPADRVPQPQAQAFVAGEHSADRLHHPEGDPATAGPWLSTSTHLNWCNIPTACPGPVLRSRRPLKECGLWQSRGGSLDCRGLSEARRSS
jgi:transposase InsO family protein